MNMKNIRIIFMLLFLTFGASFASLDDVSFKCNKKSCTLEFDFSKGNLPSFYQRYRADMDGVLKIAFSKLDLGFSEGEYSVGNNEWIKSIKVINEHAMTVLYVKTGNKINNDRNEVALKSGNVFYLKLPGTSKKSINWKLSKSSKISKTKPTLQAKTKIVKQKEAPKKEIAPLKIEKKVVKPIIVSKAKNLTNEASALVEIGVVRGNEFERIYLDFDGVAPEYSFGKSGIFLNLEFKASKLDVTLAKFNSIKSCLFSSIKNLSKKSSKLTKLSVKIKPNVSNLISFSEGSRIVFQAAVVSEECGGIYYASLKKNKLNTKDYSLLSSFAESKSLQKFYDENKSLEKMVKMSNTFSINEENKEELFVISEKVGLLSQPDTRSDTLERLDMGNKLVKFGVTGNWYRVASLAKTKGYVHKRFISKRSRLTQRQLDRFEQTTPTLGDSLSDKVSAVDSTLLFSSITEDRMNRIRYSSFGRRDPFVKLDGPSEEGINIDGVKLVGIIWDVESPMVILSDLRNLDVSYTLKEEDPIRNGKVLKITQKEVLFSINEFGVNRRYTMTLPDGPGGNK